MENGPGDEDPEAMDASARLERIRFLVEQSKLYAKFLESSIKPLDTTEPPSKVMEDDVEKPPKKLKAGQNKKMQASKQRLMTEFCTKVAPRKNSEPKDEFLTPSLAVPLHPYQLDGIKWMSNLFENGLNGILADEMGLGKTVQVIGFLAYLVEQQVKGPFLIVAPLSTLGNWVSEFERFAPRLEICKYYGTSKQRAAIRRNAFRDPAWKTYITTYETVISDAKQLSRMAWSYVIVDEGHRLKNINCKLVKELKRLKSANRLLLTGTPLQNNLTELWALLNFLLPDVFTDLDIFHKWFEMNGKLEADSEESLVESLHEILRPFVLRRQKIDVAISLPPKRENIIYTSLTPLQADLYSHILTGDARDWVVERIKEDLPRQEEQTQMIKQAMMELRQKSFSNTVMQLRLCCNSPYLFWYPFEQIDERIVSSSGKMKLLDALVDRLAAKKHKTLIFSQFTKMLDLLEDWAVYRNYTYARIDGSTAQADRQALLDEFTVGSKIQLFLLSTRSGGQGVNLTAADTVILFDSDWNPHQDMQAMDRVHRIGQTKPVLVFRLITADSVEQGLLQRAEKKLDLGNLVIDKGKFRGIGIREQLSNLGKQLQTHRSKFDGSILVSEEEFENILDRSSASYG